MTQTDRIDDLKVGEIPNPLVYQFLDGAGAPLSIVGYTAKVNIAEEAGGLSVSNATAVVTDGPNGKVTYTFTGNEFPTPGHWQIEIWVGNAGTRRYASVLILVDVRGAIGPVPAI